MEDDDVGLRYWTQQYEPQMNSTPVILLAAAITVSATAKGGTEVTSPSEILAFTSQTILSQVLWYSEIVVLVLLICSGVISNSVVFLLFYKRPTLRSFSNRFVLNLSLSHLMKSMLVLPTTMVTAACKEWLFGDFFCLTSGVLTTVLDIASVLSLLLIALDRNCAVNSPLHYSMTVTKKRTGVLITLIWASSVLVSVPPLFGITKIEYQKHYHTCTIRWSYGDPYSIAYSNVLFAVGFIVPFLTTSCVYISMFQAARSNSERARKHSLNSTIAVEATLPDPSSKPPSITTRKKYRRWSSGSSQSTFFGDEWKAVRTGLLVVVTFTVCWLPHYAVMPLQAFFDTTTFLPWYITFLIPLCSSSACIINPYLYVFRNKTARKHVRKLLHCSLRPKRKALHSGRDADGKDPQNQTNPCVLTASLVNSTSEKVKALPVLFQDPEGQWRVFSTSEERSRGEEIDETASNESDDCFEREALDYGIPPSQRKQSNINVHAIYSNSFHRSYSQRCTGTNPFTVSANRLLVFRLKAQANRDSTSSDTTDNCSMSFDSYDDLDSNLGLRRTGIKHLATSEEGDYGNFSALKRVNSFTEEMTSSPSYCNQKYISHFGSSRRRSFIHSHMKNRKSSETTLTSSGNSETLESSSATPSHENSISGFRPKLVRQDTSIMPYFEYSEETD